MTGADGNGWKGGTDPTVRTLRVVSTVVLLCTIPAMVILDRTDAGTTGAIVAGILALLGIIEWGARQGKK